MSPQVILELEKKVLNGEKLDNSELGKLINTEHLRSEEHTSELQSH